MILIGEFSADRTSPQGVLFVHHDTFLVFLLIVLFPIVLLNTPENMLVQPQLFGECSYLTYLATLVPAEGRHGIQMVTLLSILHVSLLT